MGIRWPDQHKMPRSPGPIYYPEVIKTGKVKTPAYLIVGRPKETGIILFIFKFT